MDRRRFRRTSGARSETHGLSSRDWVWVWVVRSHSPRSAMSPATFEALTERWGEVILRLDLT
jgi:hypothetical protein